MYVVRRHSRKLFFPAGLLALAWLLVLGCALVNQRLSSTRRTAVPIFPWPKDTPSWVNSDNHADRLGIGRAYYGPAAGLEAFRSWQTVEFTGNPWQDYYSARLTSFYLQQLAAAPDEDAGVRIRLQPKTTYQRLIRLMDEFAIAGLRKWLIDFRREPVTIYLITHKPIPRVLLPGALPSEDIVEITPPYQELTWLDQLGQLSQLLTNAESRQAPLLIAALAVAVMAALRLLAAAGLELRHLRTARL
ncbi:hypothetical protein [Hymenobacter sp. B81]|uniref:hypothetical protein n=1 Tax=Hymenobacter sp. B81 TaxID=3344878 RepID=UPI0037DC148D